MNFKDFKTESPEVGARILAFSPVYPKGDPMRFRIVTVPPVSMSEVVSYITLEDIEDEIAADTLFGR